MSLISSLYSMGGALNTAKTGLNVTSHNITNIETEGYTRQRIVQKDNFYSNVGRNGANDKLQVGTGVDISTLHQIRDELLDKSYRQENSRAQYYVVREEAMLEVNDILGEINGESISSEMNTLWSAINALSTSAGGIETRSLFLQTASAFAIKANEISSKLEEYQNKLDLRVRDSVNEINSLTEQIVSYNQLIMKYEASGDNANDYRDQRNLLIDELSAYGKINVTEDANGILNISFEGDTIVSGQFRQKMGLQYANDSTGKDYVVPIWSNVDEILSYKETDKYVYNERSLQNTSQDSKTDNGILRSLLALRGKIQGKATTSDEEVEGYVIPKIQKELDEFVSKLVNMINDTVTDGTYDMYGDEAVEKVFVMKDTTKDKNGDYVKGYFGNIQINQKLVDNPMLLGLSQEQGAVEDTRVVQKMLTEWKNKEGKYSPESSDVGYSQNFEAYYSELVGRIGTIGQEATGMVENQDLLISDIENRRLSVSGVSLDEEMSNMIIYQYAYSAAAKIYNTIDSMLESVISMV